MNDASLLALLVGATLIALITLPDGSSGAETVFNSNKMARHQDGSTEGVINWIVSNPPWIDYGEAATVTFSFSPPCKNVKVFKQGADSCCHFGRGCWHQPNISPRSQVRPSYELVAKNLTSAANGHYYAVCSDDVTLYKSKQLFGKENINLGIGVKPKLFAVDFHGPENEVVHLAREVVDDEILFKGSVFISAGKMALEFGVGRGHNPNASTNHEDFVFYVPEFDGATDYFGYDFVEISEPKPYTPMPLYPDGLRYRYAFKRAKLVERGICEIEGNALTALGNDHIEQVAFHLDIAFDPFISNITVSIVEFPDSRSSACLFTCHAGSCPFQKELLYDWSIYTSEWPAYTDRNLAHKGHNHIMRNQLLVDGDECKVIYAQLMSSSEASAYQISCRVTAPNGTWSQKTSNLKTLLSSVFLWEPGHILIDDALQVVTNSTSTTAAGTTETVKATISPRYSPKDAQACANSTTLCQQIIGVSTQCDKSNCVFRCDPPCGNKFCIETHCKGNSP